MFFHIMSYVYAMIICIRWWVMRGWRGHAEILRESERGNRQTATTTFVALAWAGGSGGNDPARTGTDALRAIWREHARTHHRHHYHSRTASPGMGLGGPCAQCHRRTDSGESCVASASVRPGLGRRAPRSSSVNSLRTCCCWKPVPRTTTTMKKHSKQLEKRIDDQRQLLLQQRLQGTAADKRRPSSSSSSSSSKCKNGILKNESSPELSRPASRKSRQYFLEPIRRWNSFHNSRERKSNAAASTDTATPASPSSSSTNNLPYLQTLVNLQRESKSACARLAQSVLPKTPRGAESAPVLGGASSTTVSATADDVQSPKSLQQTGAGCPAKKQNSSPNLLLVYDRRQQGVAAGGIGGGNSLTNSPRRSARRPKTPPPHPHHNQQQQQLAAAAAANSSSSVGGAGSEATSSSKIPFAIMVGDTPIVCQDTVPRIKAIRADSVTEKSSYLAVDLSPHRRYSFWSVKRA